MRKLTGSVLLAVMCSTASAPVFAQTYFTAQLSGAQEVPPVTTTGTGFGRVTLNAAQTDITVSIHYTTANGTVTMGHIHGPADVGANGPVIFNLSPATGVNAGSVVGSTFAITPAQVTELRNGRFYFNVHSTANPGGEIRGQIVADTPWIATLDSGQEVPPNATIGTGSGVVSVSPDETRILVTLSWSGLSGNAVMGHIHQGAAGANGPVIFNLSPAAATAGSVIDQQFTPTPAQLAAGKANGWYFNIHTNANPGGEIRGQIIERLFVDAFE
jgi:hypothetical protein